MTYILPEGPVAYFDVDDTLVEWKEFVYLFFLTHKEYYQADDVYKI
jgi:hypothetical protein